MGEITHAIVTVIAAESPPPGTENPDELKDAVTNEGIATAIKIVAVVLMVLLFQGMRVRAQRRLERSREARIKPWEK